MAAFHRARLPPLGHSLGRRPSLVGKIVRAKPCGVPLGPDLPGDRPVPFAGSRGTGLDRETGHPKGLYFPMPGRWVLKPLHPFLLAVGAFLFLPAVVFAWGDWQTLKTDHFMVLYKPGHEWQAWEALKALEQWRPAVQKLTGNTDPPFTAIAIQDAGAFSNGFTDPLDGDIHLFTYPPSSQELPHDNWWALLCTHEYTHMLHLNRRFG